MSRVWANAAGPRAMIDDSAAGLSPEILRRYRLTVLPPGDGRHLCLPAEVADFVAAEVPPEVADDEFLGAVFVDDLARPLGWSLPYFGYLGSQRVEAPTFVVPGMMLDAAGMILFHSRPDRPPMPRRHDLQVAKRVMKAGTLAGMLVVDYLLLGKGGYTSFDEAGKVRFPALGGRLPRDGRAKVKPKYRNPERPSQTWSGRGNMARWLEEKLATGARLEDFAVEN